MEGFIRDALTKLLPHQRKHLILCTRTNSDLLLSDAKFIASGREDVDVQMLGRGRPFALEIRNPDISVPSAGLLRKIEAQVSSQSDGKVSVKDLQLVKKKDVIENLKDEEKEKTKKYRAVCCCSRPLTTQFMDSLNQQFRQTTLQQMTPIRVLHRRPLATRSRTIFEMQLLPVHDSEHTFTLILTAESGTYIKEFVHSDFGRTSPSLSDLIGDCSTDIMSLDVEEVFVEWPPPLTQSEAQVAQE